MEKDIEKLDNGDNWGNNDDKSGAKISILSNLSKCKLSRESQNISFVLFGLKCNMEIQLACTYYICNIK